MFCKFFWDQVYAGRIAVVWYNDCDRGARKVRLLIIFTQDVLIQSCVYILCVIIKCLDEIMPITDFHYLAYIQGR